MMSADLLKLLSEGKTYLWALRQGNSDDLTPERIKELRSAFAKDGIDLDTLAAMRHLEYAIAKFPHPSVKAVDYTQFFYFPFPELNTGVYITLLTAEHGVEGGLELFPGRVDWHFSHREIQYCIGGNTQVDIINSNGKEETKWIRTGDVYAIPAGTKFTTHSSEEGGRYGHAHIAYDTLGEQEGQIYYEVVNLLRLQALEIIDPLPGQDAPQFHDISSRIEARDWGLLLNVRKDGERDLPSWLRNGWNRREECRALDYSEGTKKAVMTTPDREVGDFIDWGRGERRCFINPLIAEQSGAITDCLLPAGYKNLFTNREAWHILKGQAKIKQSIPPVHTKWVELDVMPNQVMVVVGRSHLQVVEATKDFVARRYAETCAHNGHCDMMERKLELDGVHKNC